ncbi:hypothetical protein [Delftia tsuruhatensis]|uniref:hypothetical protein n=1 Tax=Delftia tsuruhatensis TaxID=180282 RepID=UPI0020914B15|nr:hypothetical protein [Delftia tsuruhatensis]MCO5338574.1 hypothetical protein [Delftia tsuruhatensis]MCR4546642.1 hypothetical protein [Delftia tsuruhatensis]
MKKEHRYAEAFRWMADGEDVQISWGRAGGWLLMRECNEYVNDQVMRGDDGYVFRIKPKTITVGDREIEAPVMSGPGYYITDHGDAFRWFGEETLDPGANLQKLGRVFATEEAARAAQEAITALLTREPS